LRIIIKNVILFLRGDAVDHGGNGEQKNTIVMSVDTTYSEGLMPGFVGPKPKTSWNIVNIYPHKITVNGVNSDEEKVKMTIDRYGKGDPYGSRYNLEEQLFKLQIRKIA